MVSLQKQSSQTAAVGFSADRLSSTLSLDASVSKVKGVSSARERALAKMGIFTVRDLLNHFPRRYIDLSHIETIRSASINESCTVAATIHELTLKRPKPKMQLVEITLLDASGMMIVTCFRQPWLMNKLQKGMRVAVSGTMEFNYGYKRMTNPFIELLEDNQDAQHGFIVPVHGACESISTAHMRRLVRNALDALGAIQDPLPLELRCKYRLMSRQNAYETIHFPQTMASIADARRRLVYEELLLLELALMQNGARASKSEVATAHTTGGPCVRGLRNLLPFALTQDQETAIREIFEHMAAPRVMNHLLLGDVGTGKTIVAAFALCAACDSSQQAAMMAPTEVLARQYAQSIGPLLDAQGVQWGILTGSTPASERAALLDALRAGECRVLFGTHALLQPDVVFHSCSLVVIDEQQRFGVDQRAVLLEKGKAPDALYLTATPIPRTLALALFGNLSLSYLRQRPHERAKRSTFVCAKDDAQRAYAAARQALERGEQVYVVCPLVGQSAKATKEARTAVDDADYYEYESISIEDENDYSQVSIASASKKAEQLRAGVFFGFEVGLLHGKMSGQEKQAVMQQFREGKIQVLVATTVIEVGIDVANATLMIIEDADRFGLSQLHQLRGRVGRGEKPAQVFLVSGSSSEQAIMRIRAMEACEDGFELASYDLSLRREGDILGNRQHGASSLKLVNVVRDGAYIEAAHADAQALLLKDAELHMPANKPLAWELHAINKQSDTRVLGG